MHTQIDRKKIDIERINQKLIDASPFEIVSWAHKEFGQGLVMTSSFGDRAALTLDVVTSVVPDISVIVLDSRYFFPETRVFMDVLRQRFRLNIQEYYAQFSPAEMEDRCGEISDDDEVTKRLYHKIRIEEPLARAFRELHATAWISGLRGYQTRERRHIEIVTRRREDGVCAIHPLINMTTLEVAIYFIGHQLRFNPLVRKGYDSVGDQCVTKPGYNRAGRLNMSGVLRV